MSLTVRIFAALAIVCLIGGIVIACLGNWVIAGIVWAIAVIAAAVGVDLVKSQKKKEASDAKDFKVEN